MHENEVVVLLLGTAVLGFVLRYRSRWRSFPSSDWLLAAYCAALLGWLATVLEHVFFPSAMNLLEHLAYAANGLLLATWCYRVFRKGNRLERY